MPEGFKSTLKLKKSASFIPVLLSYRYRPTVGNWLGDQSRVVRNVVAENSVKSHK